MYLNNDSLHLCIYYLVEVTEPLSLFFRTYVSSLLCLCSKISTMYIHISNQIVVPGSYGSFNIQVYIKLSVRGSRRREECPYKYRADDDICRAACQDTASCRRQTGGGGVTTDKAFNKILWKTIFVNLLILPHFILLATGIQLGLFRKM